MLTGVGGGGGVCDVYRLSNVDYGLPFAVWLYALWVDNVYSIDRIVIWLG